MTKRHSESFIEALEAEPDIDKFWHALRHYRENPILGIRELKQLSDLGSALSMYYIGEAYLEGSGVEKDTRQGKDYLLKSAKIGLMEAQYQLARAHWKEGDLIQTIEILEYLSKKRHALSMNNLAYIYFYNENYKNIKLSKA